ncbi:IS5 family transposase [Pseudoalteromonas rubra]|uniref:IS5 family transposase n=1 Tax=Pseudoalteromonas rubra TaxID=43658 RepID=UPI0026931E64
MKEKRITNWRDYNKALIARGNIQLWFSEDAIEQWNNTQHHGGKGRANHFSELAIETCLTLRAVFRLSLRAAQGFISSLISMMKLDLDTPTYSCLCKRSAELAVHYRPNSSTSGGIDIVVDSTGLKVYGNGEWHARKHGANKRRTWRKLHLAVDANTHQVVGAELSTISVGDSEVLGDLLRPLRRKVSSVKADGAYDTRGCYAEVAAKKADAVIPPRCNAQLWEYGHARNSAVILTKHIGSSEWKKCVNYHQRSLAETAMYRYKQLMGDKLVSRGFNQQHTEAMIKVKVLNRMTGLGMPEYQGNS